MEGFLYQTGVARTVNGETNELDVVETQLCNFALGLTGEAGEVAELVKKHLFHGHPLSRQELIKELGDTLWYLTAICEVMQIPLGDVMYQNLSKLKERYPDGFTHEASRERSDA